MPGVFQRFPGHRQQQALLWVERDSLARRNTKERRIPLVDVIQETRLDWR